MQYRIISVFCLGNSINLQITHALLFSLECSFRGASRTENINCSHETLLAGWLLQMAASPRPRSHCEQICGPYKIHLLVMSHNSVNSRSPMECDLFNSDFDHSKCGSYSGLIFSLRLCDAAPGHIDAAPGHIDAAPGHIGHNTTSASL